MLRCRSRRVATSHNVGRVVSGLGWAGLVRDDILALASEMALACHNSCPEDLKCLRAKCQMCLNRRRYTRSFVYAFHSRVESQFMSSRQSTMEHVAK